MVNSSWSLLVASVVLALGGEGQQHLVVTPLTPHGDAMQINVKFRQIIYLIGWALMHSASLFLSYCATQKYWTPLN